MKEEREEEGKQEDEEDKLRSGRNINANMKLER